MAKKKHAHEHPDERWLLTYADMITLLMALFMVLFAMALVDKTKFEELKVTLNDTFSSPVLLGGASIFNAGTPKPASPVKQSNFESESTPISELNSAKSRQQAAQDGKTVAQRAREFRQSKAVESESLADAKRKVDKAVIDAKLTDKVQVQVGVDGLVIRLITDDVAFRSGDFALQQPIKPLLTAITPVLNSLPNDLRVEGHTDSVPCLSCAVGNQGLSMLRAAAVLQFMQGRGYNVYTHKVTPSGFADRRPLIKGVYESAKNRRVELIVVRRFVGDAPPSDVPEGPLGRPIGDDPLKLASGG